MTIYGPELGEHFATRATDGTYNAHTDRPAMLALAGDVNGLHVLDLGCGAGHYAAELRARGAARIVGVDGSETLLRAARERLGEDVPLHQHDLEQPLTFLPDHRFDLVVMAPVYHYIEARGTLLAAIRRVLKPGGTLLVSTTTRPPNGSGSAAPTSTTTASPPPPTAAGSPTAIGGCPWRSSSANCSPPASSSKS